MTGALILLCVIIVAGIVLRLLHKPDRPGEPAEEPAPAQQCCGMHLTCEKDSLSPGVGGTEPEYYDDEELDAFAGRAPEDYSPDETDMFRDVLLTLRPEEIAGWARSIQLRGIALPADVRDELIMIVSEARQARALADD